MYTPEAEEPERTDKLEIIEPENESKNEYELDAENKKYKLKIEINMDKIIFNLRNISEISYYNYIRKYGYEEIVEEFKLPKDIYSNLRKIFDYFNLREYKIKDANKNKKLIINDKYTIKLYENKEKDITDILIDKINFLIKKMRIKTLK